MFKVGILTAILLGFSSVSQAQIIGLNIFLRDLKVDPTCEVETKTLQNAVKDYVTAIVKNNSSGAQKAYGSIHHLLFDVVQETGYCFRPLMKEYILQMSVQYTPTPYWGSIPAVSAYVIEQFLIKDRFEYLTDTVRGALGPDWLKKTDDGLEYTTLGAYDCSSSKIYIDPHLRPFDLLTTLFHEVDHFLRDKNEWIPGGEASIPKKYWKSGSTEDHPVIDWTRYALEDEAQAIASSSAPFVGATLSSKAHHSISLRYIPLVADVENLTNRDYSIRFTTRRYTIHDDFNLFSPIGPVMEFEKAYPKTPEYLIAYQLYGSGIQSPALPPTLSPEAQSAREKFYQVIAQAYFPDQAQESNLSSSMGSSALGILYLTSLMTLPSDQWTLVKSLLEHSEPSRACHLYMDSLTANEVHGYLGARFSRINGKQNALRPCLNFHGAL